MPSNAADMYLVMLAVWRRVAFVEIEGYPLHRDELLLAEVAFSDYLDQLWWSLTQAELIAVNDELRRERMLVQ